ncbi:MAG: histidinol-phosphatase [Clostridia bacterium]|nr:histidinol-phosphatase [Clostridia bacterium]
MNQHAHLIDFHSHILPAVDHGSDGIEESLSQMRMIQDYGVDTIVATPHFYPELHRVEDHLAQVEQALNQLRASSLPFRSRLCVGAEVLYCDRIDRMEGLDRLCIRGTDILLLEMSMNQWGNDIFETVEALLGRYTVVLAHIDRYVRTQSEEIETLMDMGALAQINAESLFSFSARRKLAPFLEREGVVALGSDLHNTDEKAYQKFASADKKLGLLHAAIMERSTDLLRNAQSLLP